MANDSLIAKAIAYLGAVEVAPGWYAFATTHPRKGRKWYVVAAIILAVKADKHFNTSDLVQWSEDAVAMPAWWSPERKEALRCACGQVDSLDAGIACTRCDMESLSKRITADLETGAEVPA